MINDRLTILVNSNFIVFSPLILVCFFFFNKIYESKFQVLSNNLKRSGHPWLNDTDAFSSSRGKKIIGVEIHNKMFYNVTVMTLFFILHNVK
jgi:hypothetical protein